MSLEQIRKAELDLEREEIEVAMMRQSLQRGDVEVAAMQQDMKMKEIKIHDSFVETTMSLYENMVMNERDQIWFQDAIRVSNKRLFREVSGCVCGASAGYLSKKTMITGNL